MTKIVAQPSTHSHPVGQAPAHAEDPALLHEFFDHAARRWPMNPAIETPPSFVRPQRRVITYADLRRKADALSNLLREFVKEECVVAILLPRDSEHLYLAQLAVLKAGAAYTCIDPSFPDAQVLNVLEDSQAVAVLTDHTGATRTHRVKPDMDFALDVRAWADTVEGPVEPLPPASWLTPRSLAYIIYTSGTTGRPKGVMIEHGSIASLIRGDLQELDISPCDRVGQVSSSAFDSSVEETWTALTTGATLVVMSDETTHLGPDLVPWMRRERITVFGPTPTFLRTTGCQNPAKELPDLRLIYTGGEALPRDVVDRWSHGRCLINGYGPTECTVTATRARLEPGDPITIGRPVPGLDAWVLNDKLEEVADGEQGELCLGGIGLARGYMNEPELTARKFPTHPRLGRIYRTGDLVHRDADGNLFCHGRIDTQVKIRGFRIELEAIESCLAECAGVREAGCRIQGEGAQQKIAAFIVPVNAAAPPSFDDLKNSLRKALPEHMVPALFGMLGKLPVRVSGKLNRTELPVLEVHAPEHNGQVLAPRTLAEEKLASAFRSILKVAEPISVDDDFFNGLGGDSLLAAQLISKLRDDPATASLTVRDLYETRNVAELAKRIPVGAGSACSAQEAVARPIGRPVLATLIQSAWLLMGLLLGAPIAYGLAFYLLPYLTESFGLVSLLLLTPAVYIVGLVGYVVGTAALAVVTKKILIGRYLPTRAPVWGSFYVRNWIVQHTFRLIPWRMLEGTVYQLAILRALGARIGKRVHIHRGVNLAQGGWDLLDIGDDVTLSQDATICLVEFEDGQIVIGPITIGNGCTLDVRAGLAGHTTMEPESYLTPLSFLMRGGRISAGERWHGIPAKPAGQAPARPALACDERELPPALHGLAMGLGRAAVTLFVNLPTILLLFAFATLTGLDVEGAMEWLFDSSVGFAGFSFAIAITLLHVPLTLVFSMIAIRLLGRVPEGVVSRWSLAYVRVWLKTTLVESANGWLLGSLFWPVWLRGAGMKIGRGCEMSSIIDTIPELVEVGDGSFFADGIYLGGPRVHRGTVTLAMVRMGKEIFLGNNVLIAGGQTIPDGVLLGISTVADDTQLRPGTSWFGHPPFELPKREIVECDRNLTHTPMWLRFMSRLFWDCLRFALPLVPLTLVIVWFKLLVVAETVELPFPVLLFGVVPALDFGVVAGLCLFGLTLKWALLGRVKPGVHPLWSCWCSRWEFHYIAWDLYVNGPLSALEGTLLLNWFLRLMGMKIGRNVVLGSGFAATIDHDMLELADGATVSCMFQAHTFEDRVLKIGTVQIRKDATVGLAAVVLYGADIGERTYVAPHSVVMKHEKLLPHCNYVGAPTHAVKSV